MGSAPDAKRIADRARYVREQLERLRGLQQARDVQSFGAPENWTINGAVRYSLQTAVEALIDIAYHIAAKRLSAAPQDGYAAFAQLAGAGFIPRDLLPKIGRMVGFRNRVVHRYLDVDDAHVVRIVRDELGDFEAVLGALEAAAHG